MIPRAAAALFAFLLSLVAMGCHTIEVVNDVDGKGAGKSGSKWHHTGIFALVTYSGEYQIEKLCPGGRWRSLTFEMGVPQAIFNSALTLPSYATYVLPVPFGVVMAAAAVSFAYTPLSFDWKCGS